MANAPLKTSFIKDKTAIESRRLELQKDYAKYEHLSRQLFQDNEKTIAEKRIRFKDLIHQKYEERIKELEIEERAKREVAIERFLSFVKKYPRDKKTSDILFRLSELYYERANDRYYLATKRYEEDIQKENQTALEPPVPDYQESIAVYKRLINEFNSYAFLDVVYYLLGYCLTEQGQAKEGIEYFAALVNQYKNSKFAQEAYVRLGEYYFDEGRLELAIAAYQQVLAYPGSAFYDKALYKLAWSYYRLDNYQQAVKNFTAVLDLSSQSSSDKFKELEKESLAYMAICFADEVFGGYQKAIVYMNSLPKKTYEYLFYQQLADVFMQQSRFDDAILMYQYILDKNPMGKEAPAIQAQIVAAYEGNRNFSQANVARENLVMNYGPQSEWQKVHRQGGYGENLAREAIAQTLLSSAVFHHKQAQAYKESKQDDLSQQEYLLAVRGYKNYLNRFSDLKNSYEVNYFLAETLYYSGQYEDALIELMKVRDHESLHDYRETAAYMAILANEKLIERAEKNGQLKPRTLYRAQDRPQDLWIDAHSPLPALKQQLVAACDRYVVLFPQAERSVTVAYKAAETFFIYDHFDESRLRFKNLIEKYPASSFAKEALQLTVDSLMIEKKWEQIAQFSQDMLDNKKLVAQNPSLSKELSMVHVSAVITRAEGKVQQKNYVAAAEDYLQAASLDKKQKFIDQALLMAGTYFERASFFDKANQIYERLVKEYPQSDAAKKAMLRIAYHYQRIFEPQKAIDAYLRIYQDSSDVLVKAEALYSAAHVFDQQGMIPEAIKQYKRYMDIAEEQEKTYDALIRVAGFLEKQERFYETRELLDAYIKKNKDQSKFVHRIVQAYVFLGKTEERLKNYENAHWVYFLALKEGKKNADKSAPFMAQAQLRLAFELKREFDSIDIVGNSSLQKNALIKKSQALTKAKDEYQRVFQYQDAQASLEAIYQMGALYDSLASALFMAPVPPEIQQLGTQYEDEYRALLENQAFPLEDKAISAYQKVLEQSQKLAIFSPWLDLSQKSLSRLRAKDYPQVIESQIDYKNQVILWPDMLHIQGTRLPYLKPIVYELGPDLGSTPLASYRREGAVP